jgi:hypothetical protein
MNLHWSAITSTVLTAISQMILGLFLTFGLLLVMNGFSVRTSTPALRLALFVHLGVTIGLSVLSYRVSGLFVQRWGLHPAIGTALAVCMGLLIGAVMAFLTALLAVGVAEFLRTR